MATTTTCPPAHASRCCPAPRCSCQALALHLAQDDWLTELDLRRNGIGAGGLDALRAVAAERETAESEKLLQLPRLLLHLEGNADELAAATRQRAAEREREAEARRAHRLQQATRPEPRPHSAPASVSERSDEHVRQAIAFQERQLRKAEEKHRKVAESAARAMQLHMGARAASGAGAALTKQEWAGIVQASGGATELLDGIEQLIGAALRKVVAASAAEGGAPPSREPLQPQSQAKAQAIAQLEAVVQAKVQAKAQAQSQAQPHAQPHAQSQAQHVREAQCSLPVQPVSRVVVK